LVIATAGIFAFAAVSAKARQIIAFSTRAFKLRKIDANQRVCAGLPQREGDVYRRSCDESALDLNCREPLIEETYCMSMQSHLAELEKRHQALEEEITECLTHPAVDDLRIVELKRRKLLVKDEIERLRLHGRASVH
jgi:hypothetical protein